MTSGRPAPPTRWRPPTQRLRNPEVRSHGGAAGEAGGFGAGRPGAAGGLAGDRWLAAAEVQVSSRGGREWRLEPRLCIGLLLGSWGVRAGCGLEDAWTLRGLSLAGLPWL